MNGEPEGGDPMGAALALIEELSAALDASVTLQSHYAELLNMHDGGKRMTFTTATWLARLKELRERKK